MNSRLHSQRDDVRRLWQVCFNDSPAFIELYFRLRYSDDNTVVRRVDGRTVSAMQLLPYPLDYFGTRLKTEYVSGACTDPDYRRRGLMTGLLTEAMQAMRRRGVVLATLIPADSELFGYYARVGFATAFTTGGLSTHVEPATGSEQADYIDETDREAYRYLLGKQAERPCGLLHTEDDWAVILADLNLCGGCAAALRDERGQTHALIVAYPMFDREETSACRTYRVEECLADDEPSAGRLLSILARDLSAERFVLAHLPFDGGYRIPLGMARLIDAPAMLSAYAQAHPESAHHWHIVDSQLPDNTAYYDLEDGRCTVRPTPQAGNVYEEHTPAEIVGLVLRRFEPRMNLMLN